MTTENEYALNSILKEYQTPEVTRLDPTKPRTQHDIQSHIGQIESPRPHQQSKKDVVSKLFAPLDGNILLNHPSDEEDSVLDHQASNSSLDLVPTHNSKFGDYYVYLSDHPQSIFRSTAYLIFGDESLSTIMQEQLHLDKKDTKDSDILQAIANMYHHPIHVHGNQTFVNIITPNNTWEHPPKEPIQLLKYQKHTFAALTKQRTVKVHWFNKIAQPSSLPAENDIENQIRNTFMEAKSWTPQDEIRHQVLIQGPSSLDDLHLEWETQTQDSLECHTERRDSLTEKVLQRSYSPTVSRKSFQSSQNTESQEDLDFQRAIELSMQDMKQDQENQFDVNLTKAIQMSLQEQTYDRKGKGKARFQ